MASGLMLSPLVAAPSIHHEAIDWATRVSANGGTISTTTLRAVSDFCAAIDGGGLRDRFVRLNPFAGGNLSGALVPLYRSTSFEGTVIGNATDTNNNFVSGDYTETGTQAGLAGNGTTKFLATGVLPTTLSLGDNHLSVYSTKANTVTAFAAAVGLFVASGGAEIGLYYCQANIATAAYYAENNGSGGFVVSAANNPTGHLLGAATSTTSRQAFVNGTQSGSTATVTSTIALTGALDINVFRRNATAVGSRTFSSPTLGAYSIGRGMTAAQAAAFYAALQNFQTALRRNV
jgi:hypothetical protein